MVIPPLLVRVSVLLNVPPMRSEEMVIADASEGFALDVESPIMTVDVDVGKPFDQLDAVVQLVVVPFQYVVV